MSLLHRRPEERVRIVVPRVAAMDALVVRVVSGAAELLIASDAGVPVRFLHRRRAVVMPLAGDDRIDGTLLAVPGRNGRVRDDVLHFLEDVIPLAPPTPRRREFARVPVVRPVAMVPAGFRVGWLNGFTRDLSAGGALVAGAGALEIGDRLRLRFELSEDEMLDLMARVVREHELGLRGLRLEGLDEHVRERIVRFVFEKQRRALAELRARAV